MTITPTYISLSAVRTFQRCQQQYDYRYIKRIKRRTRAIALDRGVILHEYLEHFYKGLKDGLAALDSHDRAQYEISHKWRKQLKRYSEAAFVAGEEEAAREFADLEAAVVRISSRYYEQRGKHDAEQYEIEEVEQKLDSNLTKRIRTVGYCDLRTLDRETGRRSIWEHKSTKNVPPASLRLRDLQTLLYGEQLARFYETPVDSVIWNYIRTKEPAVPEPLKSSKVPALTKRKDIDSTWEVYEAAAVEHGVDLSVGYEEVRNRLEGRELTQFFPRFDLVTVADSTVMLRDYVRTGLEIRRFKQRVEAGEVQPIRALDMSCDFCEFDVLCTAAITGGDVEELIEMKFESAARTGKEERNSRK